MTDFRRLLQPGMLTLVVLASGLSSTDVAAQRGDRPDFRFERPSFSFIIKGGASLPSANSEIFDFTIEQLTIADADFYSPSIGVEGSFRVTRRVDVALGVSIAQSVTVSEFREFVGEDDLPIEQTTKFTRVPTTLSVKYYLSDRGREIGRFAWIAERVVPYVGAGGGVIWYEFEQDGEWVDFETLDIFGQSFKSDGATGVGHVLAGAELSIGPRWFINIEGRYSFASMRMNTDFVDFDNIDLGGFDATVGFAIRH
jgi:opacity protein-like surface antigen